MRSRALWHAFDQRQTRGWSNVGNQSPGTSGRLKRSTSVTAISKCLLSDLRTRLCYCPRSRCTNRDWDESHAQWLTDAGFYSCENEKAGHALGVQWMSVPNKKTKSRDRKLLQRQRWFRSGQKWRTGCEGRISTLKRRQDCVAACTPV
jgi:hypothetical protein